MFGIIIVAPEAPCFQVRKKILGNQFDTPLGYFTCKNQLVGGQRKKLSQVVVDSGLQELVDNKRKQTNKQTAIMFGIKKKKKKTGNKADKKKAMCRGECQVRQGVCDLSAGARVTFYAEEKISHKLPGAY